MLVNRLRQSVNEGLKVTVTVSPFGQRPALRSAVLPAAQAAPLAGAEPTIDWIWLYPALEAES